MNDVVVYLVPVGVGRFELYTEPLDDTAAHDGRRDGFWSARMHRLRARWNASVHAARSGGPRAGRLARLRDWAISRAAESVAEQRTLWSLRNAASASLVHPTLDSAAAAGVRQQILVRARRHHGLWLLVDALAFAASGLFFFIPGPNVIAYYFALRTVGHFLSWRGTRQALNRTRWTEHAEPALTALGELATVPRAARADRVAAIVQALNLPRLAAFFDRAAPPSR